jgi:hypothetical protein
MRYHADDREVERDARACLLATLNPELAAEVERLSRVTNLRMVCDVPAARENRSFYIELVLRFFCQVTYDGPAADLPNVLPEHLNRWTVTLARRHSPATPAIDPRLFERTFRVLAESLRGNALRRWEDGEPVGVFSESAFEFVVSGVSANIDDWERRPRSDLAERVRGIWTDPEFLELARPESLQLASPDFLDEANPELHSRTRFPRLVLRARYFFGV